MFLPICKLQLVSLAQAGNEITQGSLKNEGKLCFDCFFTSRSVVEFECLNWIVSVGYSDLSTLDPPVMEGVDQLVAVSLKFTGSFLF